LRLWSCPYDLKPRRALSERATGAPRSGALVRIEFEPGCLGYADLHPWTELGDAPLSEQIADLSQWAEGKAEIGDRRPEVGVQSETLNRLARNTLRFAQIDADARMRGRSLWEGVTSHPANHFLLPYRAPGGDAHSQLQTLDSAADMGFSRFKCKLPSDPEAAIAITRELAHHIRHIRALILPTGLRLDFNSSLTKAQYQRFVSALGDDCDGIDYVEDPTPWNSQNGFGALPSHPPLAVDFEASQANGNPRAPAVRIVKPAIQDWDTLLSEKLSQRTIISSYLDHPLGQCFAVWVAATRGSPSETHGLASHLSYEPNAFSERLELDGPRLLVPRVGTGIGFDELLEKLPWKTA
jgi:o-succinylbenzoate synthase